MKPNLPAPPSDLNGFHAEIAHEATIDQEYLDRFTYAEPCDFPGAQPGLWQLYIPPTDEKHVLVNGIITR